MKNSSINSDELKKMVPSMTLEEIDARLSEIGHQKTTLSSEEWQLRQWERELIKQKLQHHVGRCFQKDQKYWCIIGVPQEQYTKTATIFNEFQLPAMVIDLAEKNPLEAIYEDHFFRGMLPEEERRNPFFCEKAIEITPDHFNAILEEAFASIKGLVSGGRAAVAGTEI